MPLPSASSIGRIIGRDPHAMRCAPTNLTATGRTRKRNKTHKTRRPQGFVAAPLQTTAADTIIIIRDGQRRAIFTFIDPISRLAFAIAAPNASSKQAAIALDAWCKLLPQPPQYILTDNGSEFKGAFDQSLADRGITHW